MSDWAILYMYGKMRKISTTFLLSPRPSSACICSKFGLQVENVMLAPTRTCFTVLIISGAVDVGIRCSLRPWKAKIGTYNFLEDHKT